MKCKICGKEFTGRKTSVCCSDDCKLENKRQLSREWAAKHYKSQAGAKTSICVVCGKEFTVQSGGTIVCSSECRAIRRKEKERSVKKCTCAYCGNEFETLHIKKYCSVDCRNKSKAEAAKADRPERTCKVCGKRFKPKTGRSEYCSKQCQKKLYRDRQSKRWATESGISLEYEHKPSHIDNKEMYARAKGLHYADLQKRETVDMFARVELPEWAKGER